VATINVAVKESIWVLPHISGVFHAYALTDTLWVAQHYPVWHPKGGRVSSNSTPHDASKFAGPHEIPYAPVHQPTRALIDSGGGYMLELQIYDLDHSPSFPSSILHYP
jgi:hypothetical protein